MARVITKEDVQAACDKAAAKAKAAARKECLAQLKTTQAFLLEDSEVTKDYKAVVKYTIKAATDAIKDMD